MISSVIVEQQLRCSVCGAVDGWEYPHGENGEPNECVVDPRNLLCDRFSCVQSRDIPSEASPEDFETAARDAQRRAVHPSLRAWARSQKHHTTDPNLHRPERMFSEVVRGSGILPPQSTSSDVARGLYHKRLLNSFESEPSSEYSSTQLSFGSNRPDVRRHIEEGAAATATLIIEFEEDAARYRSSSDELKYQQMYEDALKYMMVKEWEKEKAEAILIRDEAFAEAEAKQDELWKYQLLRTADLFLPARPHLLPDIGGIKLQGFKRGIPYNSEAKGNTEYSTEQKSSEMRERYNAATTQSDDEEVESSYYSDGDGFNNEGMRKTKTPLNLVDLRARYRAVYNPSGTTTKEEVEQRISEKPNDAIDYVTELDNIPKENIRAYKEEEKVNTVIQQQRRRKKTIESIVKHACPDGSCLSDNCAQPDPSIAQELTHYINRLPEEDATAIFRQGGYYAAYTLDRYRLVRLKAADENEAQAAIILLFEKVLREALRQALRKVTNDSERDRVSAEVTARINAADEVAIIEYIVPEPDYFPRTPGVPTKR